MDSTTLVRFGGLLQWYLNPSSRVMFGLRVEPGISQPIRDFLASHFELSPNIFADMPLTMGSTRLYLSLSLGVRGGFASNQPKSNGETEGLTYLLYPLARVGLGFGH